MRDVSTCFLVFVLAATFPPTGWRSAEAWQIVPASDAPQPHSPEESRALFRVSKGFHVELVAAEPALADPVAMAFDPKGRIFVCEIHGYNLEGYLDVLELNKTGVLDRTVRRIPANDHALKRALEGQYGTVKLLEDSDGDGRVDRWTVWADHLPPCYGVVPARGGVIVLCAPEIVFLADRDGDGAAEVRQTLFSGFGVDEMWSRINNPRWEPDNWIYAAGAIGSGGTIRGPNLHEEVQMGATSFRFKPDGSAIEPCSGTTSGFGLAIDDWGGRFLVTNQQHVLYVAPIDRRYLARNPFYSAPNPLTNISSYGHPARVYPTSRPHPWRQARSEDPRWVKFYGAAEATANGYFTAASGQTIYQDRIFPREYWGNHFSVDNAQNMIHRCLLDREGSGYVARRAPGEETVEFLTSTEQWFRPVNLTTGPDGALYVVDMYREIIEDYSAIPRYLQQQYGLITGADRGRIWRIVADAAPTTRQFDLAATPSEQLVRELAHPNAWRRQTAQRLLVERGDRSVGPAICRLAADGEAPQTRLHAIHALDGLESLDVPTIEGALGDKHFAVRVHALRLAEKWLDEDAGVTQSVFRLAEDPDPWVRLQLALTLGESRDDRRIALLAKLAASDGDDPWMRAAIVTSMADSSARLLGAIRDRHAERGEGTALIHPLASVVGARRDDEEIGSLLEMIEAADRGGSGEFRLLALKGLVEGLGRGQRRTLVSAGGRRAVASLLIDPSAEVSQLALRVAGLLRLAGAPEIKAAYARAAEIALDETQGSEDRTRAAALLIGADYPTLEPIVRGLLDARRPLDLQLAAIRLASSSEDPRAATLLLANWSGYTPKVQEAAIGAIFNRQNRLPALLDAIGDGSLPASALGAFHRVQLMENPDGAIRRRAQSLLGAGRSAGDRDRVLAQYLSALEGPRDSKRGQQVYLDQCAKCHRLQGQGFQVGPDLATITSRADETVIADVLDPSRQLTVGYQHYTVITTDGRIFTGILAAETATGISLRKEEGVEETILRRDVEEMAASSISMMPEELEKEVTPRDLVDLIAYLRETLGPATPGKAILFDDEPEFADLLTDGSGTASLDSLDAFAGQASLAIGPPQRFASRIPTWAYRICENPQPGEFRYLRFAWKARGARGLMIELAADGQWPSADEPVRRYYCGQNTSGWQALELASEAPGDWVVVTRDLWKDFGPFTLTGIAPTAMGGEGLFDRIELLQSLDAIPR